MHDGYVPQDNKFAHEYLTWNGGRVLARPPYTVSPRREATWLITEGG